jgi:predicted O-methyltransferase YrrM
VRLLRGGGIIALHGVLTDGVLNPDVSDAGSVALREVARQAREDDRLIPVLLPLGGGLLAAVKRTTSG